jgi:hypothetical protein
LVYCYWSFDIGVINIILPTQEYSFELAKKLISKKIPIVMIRSEKLWTNAIPDLLGHNLIKAKNVRNPSISINNLGLDNFELIKDTLMN